MAAHEVDLFVVGAGSGGVRAARIASTHGAKVAIAEEYRYGGTCVIRGCVPKKLLVYASRYAGEFEDAVGYGWKGTEASFDWPTLIGNKDREIDRLEAAYKSTLERAGVKPVHDRAELEDAHTIRLESGERYRAKHILIATGGMVDRGPDIPGIEHVITSNEAFYLKQFPKRIVIQGGGYIALEFACIFRGLGADVTLVYRGEQILRGFDDDLRAHLASEMTKRGIKIICGQTVKAVEKAGSSFRANLSGGESMDADQVMFAIGRKPNTAKMGLDAAGVKLNGKGAIAVDRYSRSSVSHIYAVGDVTDRINLTPVAIREGHAFADTVFGGKDVTADHEDVPSAVFTEPECGVVGLTEAQAREKFDRVDIYKTTFRPMKATVAGRDMRSFFKLVVDGKTDRVLGCHIVGPEAGEMIQLVGIAVKMKATKADFDAVMAVHPTGAEELVTMRERAATFSREEFTE